MAKGSDSGLSSKSRSTSWDPVNEWKAVEAARMPSDVKASVRSRPRI